MSVSEIVASHVSFINQSVDQGPPHTSFCAAVFRLCSIAATEYSDFRNRLALIPTSTDAKVRGIDAIAQFTE